MFFELSWHGGDTHDTHETHGDRQPHGRVEAVFRERIRKPKALEKAYLGSGQHPKESREKKRRLHVFT